MQLFAILPVMRYKQFIWILLITTGYACIPPVVIKGLNSAAEPVRFLDYLIEENQPAAVPMGSGLLIRIPAPARFALHKLVVSRRRPAAMAD